MLLRNLLKGILTLLLTGALNNSALAQTLNDQQLADNLSNYAKANPSTILFVHTDTKPLRLVQSIKAEDTWDAYLKRKKTGSWLILFTQAASFTV